MYWYRVGHLWLFRPIAIPRKIRARSSHHIARLNANAATSILLSCFQLQPRSQLWAALACVRGGKSFGGLIRDKHSQCPRLHAPVFFPLFSELFCFWEPSLGMIREIFITETVATLKDKSMPKSLTCTKMHPKMQNYGHQHVKYRHL